MKLYDMGAALILGIILMGGAAKVNHDKTEATLRKEGTEKAVVRAEAICGEPKGNVYYVPIDTTNIPAIMRNLKIGDTIELVEGIKAGAVSEVQEPVKDEVKEVQAAPSEPAPTPSWSFKPNEKNPPLNEVQKAIKNALETIIENEGKADGK